MKKKNQSLIPLIFDLAFKKMFSNDFNKEKVALLISIFLDINDINLKNYIELINESKENNQKKYNDSITRIKLYFSTNEKICLKVILHLNQEMIDRNINSLEKLFKNSQEEKQLQINFTTHDFTKENLKNGPLQKKNQRLVIYHIHVEECFYIYQTEAFQYYSEKMKQEILLGSLLVQKNRKNFQKILRNIHISQELKQEILQDSLKISSDQKMIQHYYLLKENKH